MEFIDHTNAILPYARNFILLTFEFMDEIDSPNIDNKVDEY